MKFCKAISILWIFFTSALNCWAGGLAIDFSSVTVAQNQIAGTNRQIESVFQSTYSNFIKNFSQDQFSNKCQVKLRFARNLNDYWGSVETERKTRDTDSTCEYEIEIAEILRGKVESQLVLIHEMSHVVRDFHQPFETRWVQEGLAQVLETEYIGLWPLDKQAQFLKNDQIFLSENDDDYVPNGKGYSSSFFFMKYLYNHFGGKVLMQKIMTSKLKGWDNIENSVLETSRELGLRIPEKHLTRVQIWLHYTFAILLNDPQRADYGLLSLDSKFSSAVKAGAELTNLFRSSEREAFKYVGLFQTQSLVIRSHTEFTQQALKVLDSKKILSFCLNLELQFQIKKMNEESSCVEKNSFVVLVSLPR